MKIYLERFYISDATNLWFIKADIDINRETKMNDTIGMCFSLGAYRNKYKKINIKNIITKLIAIADDEAWSLGITEDDGGLDYIMKCINLSDFYYDNHLLEVTLTPKESKYLSDWFERRLEGDYKNDKLRDIVEYFYKKLKEKQ